MQPMTVRLPHKLSREEVKTRLQSRIGELPNHIPGGFATVDANWTSEDEMALRVGAMGQDVDARLLLEPDAVRVTFTLPAALGFFRGLIEKTVEQQGARLLSDKRDPDTKAG